MVNDRDTAVAETISPVLIDRRKASNTLSQAEMPDLPQTRLLQFDDLTSPVIRTAIGYWLSKQHNGLAMQRRDFDPTEIPHLLPYLILLEVLREGPGPEITDFRYRVIGDVLLRYSRGNYTGLRFSEVDGQAPGSEVFTICSNVATQRRPLLLRPPYVGPHRHIFFCESSTMPLVDEAGETNRILIACDFLPEAIADHRGVGSRA